MTLSFVLLQGHFKEEPVLWAVIFSFFISIVVVECRTVFFPQHNILFNYITIFYLEMMET